MSLFSLLLYSMVNNYALSHPNGVPPRVPHNDDIDNLFFFLQRPYFLLLLVAYCFLHWEGVLHAWLMPWCSVEVEISVHRTFLVTERGFSMTDTSVLKWSYSLAEKILLWVKPTSSGHQGSSWVFGATTFSFWGPGAADACWVVTCIPVGLLACINELLQKVFHGKRGMITHLGATVSELTWPRVSGEFSFRPQVMTFNKYLYLTCWQVLRLWEVQFTF